MSKHLPDKTIRCHRTGFKETCFKCVTEHGCRLWKHVRLEGDPRLPEGAAQSAVDHWDCADSLADLYLRDMLRRQLQTTATVDKLSNEVRTANDTGMANALMGINHEVRRLAGQERLAIGSGSTKLIESAPAQPDDVDRQH